MKIVVDASTVAHLWANKSQDEAKNANRSFYFDRDTIYSYGYHFPIAKHVTNANGEQAILFTTRSYSNTTAKHIAMVRQALFGKIIRCAFPDSKHDHQQPHSENFEWWLRRAEEEASKLMKAKKPEIYLSELSSLQQQAQVYAEFFNLTIPLNLQAIFNITNKEEFSVYNAKKAEYKKAEDDRILKETAKKHKEQLVKWNKFELHRLFVRDGYDYLRYNKEKGLVETTQGVDITFGQAIALYKTIQADGLKVGDTFVDWTVKEVGDEIVINCHRFTKKYLLKFGKKIAA